MSSEATQFLVVFPDQRAREAVSGDSTQHIGSSLNSCVRAEKEETELVEEKSFNELADAAGKSDDRDLVAQIAGGSRAALGLIFRKYQRTVWSIARRILRDDSEAEDLCQEVFLLLFEKAKLYDPNKGTASSWIIQIAYHRAMNRRQYLQYRQHYDSRELDEQKVGGTPPLSIDGLVARNLLKRLREQLSEEQNMTLELHFFEGYSLREIAEKTNQTLGNVRHHFYRGLDRLRSNVFPKKDT